MNNSSARHNTILKGRNDPDAEKPLTLRHNAGEISCAMPCLYDELGGLIRFSFRTSSLRLSDYWEYYNYLPRFLLQSRFFPCWDNNPWMMMKQVLYVCLWAGSFQWFLCAFHLIANRQFALPPESKFSTEESRTSHHWVAFCSIEYSLCGYLI